MHNLTSTFPAPDFEAALDHLRELSLGKATDYVSAAEHLAGAVTAASAPAALQLRVRTELADAFRVNGRYEEALGLLQDIGTEAATLPEAEADAITARAHLYAAVVHDVVNSVAAGLEHVTKAAELYGKLGDSEGAARAKTVSGGLYYRVDALAESIAACGEALAYYREAGEDDRAAMLCANLCLSHWRSNRLAEAASYGREAVAGARRPLTRLLATLNLARVLAEKNRFGEARELLAEADTLQDELADPNYSGGYLLTLAGILRRQGENGKAQETLEQLLAVEDAHTRPRVFSQAHLLLSELHEENGNLGEALRCHRAYHALALAEAEKHAARQLDVRRWQLEVDNARRQAEDERERSRQLEHRISRLHEQHEQVAARARQMEEHSLLDPLTGLANRRRLDVWLAGAAVACRESGRDTGLLMVDLDRFKRVNDRYGHLLGDTVLKHVARLIEGSTRSTDLCCRFGGEEFIIVLDSVSDAPTLERIGEKVRQAVSGHDWGSLAEGLELTCSVGGARMQEAGCQALELLRLADGRLYRAKELGRNRTVARG